MKKTEEGLNLLMELAARDWTRARIIALKIPSDKLDCGTLIEFQQSSDSNVRNLARELALKIPTDKLDCGTLIEFQQSSDSNVRNLARELALKIPTDKLDCGMLIKFQQSSDPNVRNLARELLLLNFPDTVVNNSKDEELEQKILAYFQ